MLFALALIPVIALLCFIYFNDKKEKEPIGLLIGLFFAGIGSIIPAIIGEAIGQAFLNVIIPYNSVIKGYIFAILIVGPAEEIGKYLMLRLITWKSKNFNYSYDAIVYAVFVSLGFAAIENVGYVFMNGIGTALLRMFTAVPGHACFAVFMGYFYSKSKYAKLTRNGKAAGYTALSLILPILTHGVYDAIIMGARESDFAVFMGLSAILWIGYVIALFVVSCIIIVKSSRNDFCIVTLPGDLQTVYRPAVAGTWKCECGTVNYFNYCSECGRQRPANNTTWNCPKCGTLSSYNFCGNCGCPKPGSQQA